jgi:hypothetical protein
MKENQSSFSFIEPVLLTKLYMLNLSKQPIGSLMPCLNIIAVTYKLNLSRVRDLKISMKILEDSIFKN